MRNLYISKDLIKQGVRKEEVWEIVDQFDKECILHEKYKYASLLPIRWMPKYCAITPTLALILVLTDIQERKHIQLIYFYKDGILCKSGEKRKFFYLYQIHIYKDGELGDVEKSLPMRLQKCFRVS